MSGQQKFVLRVDDCGWVPPDKHNDDGLKYFRRWRDAVNPGGKHPAVYGFIPTTIATPEIDWLAENLSKHELVAVHGWDHAAGADIDVATMRRALAKFAKLAPRIYIPPFNKYREATVRAWGAACREVDDTPVYFLGGMPDRDHAFGESPVFVGDVLHTSAPPMYYGRGPELLPRVVAARAAPTKHIDRVEVLTLHVTWDSEATWSSVRRALDAAQPVSPDAFLQWRRDADRLTAGLEGAPRTAFEWVLRHLSPSDKVLDVGSRYSLLPTLEALHGCVVTACDRDPKVSEWQQRLFTEYGLSAPQVLQCDVVTHRFEERYYAISACWALQHNLAPGAIEAASANLANALLPSGKILVVSSYTPGQTRLDLDRADPQIVMSLGDHYTRVVEPSECLIEEISYFRYEHGKSTAYASTQADANAICYELRSNR